MTDHKSENRPQMTEMTDMERIRAVRPIVVGRPQPQRADPKKTVELMLQNHPELMAELAKS